MTSRPTFLRALLLAALLGTAGTAGAQGLRPATYFVQGGGGQHGLAAAGVGVQWPFAWRSNALAGEFTAHAEAFASVWRAHDFGGGNQAFVQLGLVPVLRYRLDAGRSPWFVEGGIGVSLTDKAFATPERTQGSRWNFSDNVAVGRNFGVQGQHELSLRWQHTSNAGLKKPNPGIDLLMLRYATRF